MSAVDAKVHLLRQHFFHRADVIAIARPNGKPQPATTVDLDAAVRAHVLGDKAPPVQFTLTDDKKTVVSGRPRLGAYFLTTDGTIEAACVDIDGGDGHAHPVKDPDGVAVEVCRCLIAADFVVYLEKSGSGTGWHVWVFFDKPTQAAKVRRAILAVLPNVELRSGGIADARLNQGIELFPKQDSLTGKGLGNLVWLPYWSEARPGANAFYSMLGSSIGLQCELSQLQKTSLPEFREGAATPASVDAEPRQRPSSRTNPPSAIPSDADAVFVGCGFIKHCHENQPDQIEPHWLAALSIAAFLEDGERHCHRISEKHPGYTVEKTQAKIDRALAQSGPRTCRDIKDRWDGCEACPNYGRVRSPVDIGRRARAQKICDGAVSALAGNAGAVWEDLPLSAFAYLRRHNAPCYQRMRPALKKGTGNITAFEKRIEEVEKRIVATDDTNSLTGAYKIEGGRHVVANGKTGIPDPLCNFCAEIVTEETQDDGSQECKVFELAGSLDNGAALPSIWVPATRFDGLSWITEKWGPEPIIMPGKMTRECLSVAIRVNSQNQRKRHVYIHTGWVTVEGQPVYLHSGGGIDANGNREDISVRFEGCLGLYDLSQGLGQYLAADAAGTYLKLFFSLAPPEIIAPLLAAVYCAVLAEAICVDFSIFLTGPTGTFKSELTALIQNAFGPKFSGRNLPANWSSTANALERASFLAKDAVLGVDDFCPKGSQSDVQKLHQKADLFLRNVGNHAGRGRMRSDLTLRPDFVPRGLVISSGEDVPRGQSLRARMLICEVGPNSILKEVLTTLQQQRHMPSQILSRFIQWVAPRIDSFKATLPGRRETLRSSLTLDAHRRTADIIAPLQLGWDVFLEFSDATGLMSLADLKYLETIGRQGLIAAGAAQSELLQDEDPARRFVNLLVSSIASGFASVQIPFSYDDRSIFWKGDSLTSIKIGFINDREELVLVPEAALAAVNKLTGMQDPMTGSRHSIGKSLAAKGWILTEPEKNGVKRVTAEGNQSRLCWVFQAPMIERLLHELKFGPSDSVKPGNGNLEVETSNDVRHS